MTSLLRKILVYWLPLLLYIGLIILISSLSRLPFLLPRWIHLDKLLHMLEYAVLAVLVTRAFLSVRHPSRLWAVGLVSFGCVVAFGVMAELLQGLVPGRSSDAMDLVADGVGGLLGSLVYLLFKRRAARRARARSRQPCGREADAV